MREVCIQRILAKVSREGRATSPMQRMKETCNVKLMSWRRSCVAHGEGAHHLTPSCLPRRPDNATYRRRFRTPPSETFSYDEEYRHRRKNKSPPHKSLGNNAMNEVLSQVAKSPFRRNIEGASLPRRFHQPIFTLYNSRTDPVEHVSHFS